MLDLTTLQKIDSNRMYEIYDKWPSIAKNAFELKYEKKIFTDIEHLIFAGMGGSGSIGDIFSSILSKSMIHVNVVKGYDLPKTANSKTLVVITSVSGDTAETLSVLKSAHKLRCKIIAFSSGGKIKKYCVKNKIQYLRVPMYHSPRASFTNYLYTMLNVLYSSLQIKREDIIESISQLEKLGKEINSSNLTESNHSLELAKWITDIPIIYYPFGLQSVAIRFKNSLQENAKMHVFVEDGIEVCHNGIVSWERESNVHPILLQGQDDHIKTKERWEIIENLFQIKNINYKKIMSNKGNILSKLISLIYLVDYSTIYKAVLDNIDPSPVKSIDFVKKYLK